MKRCIIISCLLSIIGHGLFFGIFRTDVKAGVSYSNTQLYLITREQFDYLRRGRDVIVSSLPRSLSSKNPLWKDTLDLKPVRVVSEEMELLEDFKTYNFHKIQIAQHGYPELNRDILPSYGDLFFSTSLNERIEQGREYYIQGPVAARRLFIENAQFNVGKQGIKARFRFWVTRDGRVNQVIIEEGSSFPLVDMDLVNFIKTWRFSPSTSNYEWGIVRVKFTK